MSTLLLPHRTALHPEGEKQLRKAAQGQSWVRGSRPCSQHCLSWFLLEPTALVQIEDTPEQVSLALQHPKRDGDKDMGSKSTGMDFQG